MKSDPQTRLNVLEALIWEPDTQSERVGVEVEEGRVVLTGFTDTGSQRWHANKAAARVHGVVKIENQIKVRYSQSVTPKMPKLRS